MTDEIQPSVEKVPIFGSHWRSLKRWRCSCGRGAWRLWAVGGGVAPYSGPARCRHCIGKRHRRRTDFERAEAMRRKLKIAPFPAPLPSPVDAPRWSRREWYQRLDLLQRLEAKMQARFDAVELAIERDVFLLATR
jgi:hypothetical protein